MTETSTMTLTTQLRNRSNKKESITSFLHSGTRLDLRRLVEKLEQAEITMKLKETENQKLHYVNNIQTTTSQISNTHDSDTYLSENITEILNISKKTQMLKVNHHSKDTDTVLPNADKNRKIIAINHKSIENQINCFIST